MSKRTNDNNHNGNRNGDQVPFLQFSHSSLDEQAVAAGIDSFALLFYGKVVRHREPDGTQQ